MKAAKHSPIKDAPDSKRPMMPSSWEFQQLAEACLDAANAAYADCQRRDEDFAAGKHGGKFTFMAITVAFLYLRSVELALKAAITERALATAEAIPSRKLGHDLKKLIECATTSVPSGPSAFTLSELGMDQASQAFLERYSCVYANKWFEYSFKPSAYPSLKKSQQIATSIIEATKSIARTLPPFRPSKVLHVRH